MQRHVYIEVLLAVVYVNVVTTVVLPSIVLNPWNPVFSCEVPTINAHLYDQINFYCPPRNHHYYVEQENDKVNLLYENLFFLGEDIAAFNECNATQGKLLLKCSDPTNPGVYNLYINQLQSGPDKLVLHKGKSYYFIDTAFHTKDTLSDKIGGSCNKTDKNGQYKIRFKLYICTDEDDKNGNCNRCTSEACLYKDCRKTCTPWTTVSESTTDKNILQKRLCTNLLLNENVTEFQTISAPPLNCTEWNVELSEQTGQICKYMEKRNCMNSLGKQFIEWQEYSSKCSPAPASLPRTDIESNEDTYLYIAIGASITCFLIGVVLGTLCKMHHYKRRQRNNTDPYANSNGIPNVGFDVEDGSPMKQLKIKEQDIPVANNNDKEILS